MRDMFLFSYLKKKKRLSILFGQTVVSDARTNRVACAFLSLATVRVFNKKYEEKRERERVDISRGQRADKSTCASARGLRVIRE